MRTIPDQYKTYSSWQRPELLVWSENDYAQWAAGYLPLIHQWLPGDRKARIADLGCGTGNLLWLLRDRGFEDIHGVDVDTEQVALAIKIAPTQRADASEWLTEFEDHFDVLFALDFIEHLGSEQAETFLDRCFRALRARGRLVLQTPNALALRPVYAFGDPTHRIVLSARSAEGLLRRARFGDIESKECRPVDPRPIKGCVRSLLWEGVRALVKRVDVLEAFDPHSTRILTRNMFVTGIKR